ncbi:hypothetical protein HID58_067296 [Brassica napus]|uniref:Protein FAR1-RELATED SEQUENCE n=1 Tax=Brassica napus TaxID=3708 RepID=A0ABQ7ZI48_BRANA|nr:hypothetical protein HID58_067296 [Brassica napus]
MRRSCRTTLAIKRPHRQRLKRRSLTNKITSNRPNPRTYPKNKATKDVKVHAKRSLLHQSTTTLPITMFLQESRGTFDDRRKLEDATTLPERRKDQAEIGTKATAQRKSRRQRSNQTGKGSRREAVVITGEVSGRISDLRGCCAVHRFESPNCLSSESRLSVRVFEQGSKRQLAPIGAWLLLATRLQLIAFDSPLCSSSLQEVMDIDLRLHSGDLCKEGDDEEHRGLDNEDIDISKVEDDVTVEVHTDNNSTAAGITLPEHNTQQQGVNLEPLNGMEFNSHGEAYTFYQEYSRTIGFNTAIQNSRRSKTTREFIDAKFACSRYGTKREYDKSFNRPRARQSKQDHPENNMSGRRTCAKTDCKASMHVKRKPDGKWVIHSFVRDHNHDLLPAQAVSEQTRKIYAAMAKQFAEYKTVISLKSESKTSFEKDRFEEEAKADSETWNKPPTMKSPSPFEKSVSDVYTPAVFKKFQIEVLGAIACSPREENRDATCSAFRVQDFENNQDFVVSWSQAKAEVSCMCRLFEYKGYLCRHTLNVLQCCHLSSIPSQYILKRWTKDARSQHCPGEPQQLQTRLQRYNDLCQRALKLSEEASISQESYNIAFPAIEEALGNCAGVNTSGRSLPDVVASPTQGLISVEEDNQSRSAVKTTSKKKNPTKKRKVNSEQEVIPVAAPESLQQMDKLSPRTVGLESYYGTQQSVQNLVQLNLMAPNRDNFYGNQQTIQGLRQLNSIAPSYDSYYTAQQGIHGQGVDFFRPPNFTYDIRDDPNVRTTQLHEDASRHT